MSSVRLAFAMAYYNYKLECEKLQREVEDEKTNTDYWRKRCLDAERETAALKQRCLEAERWAKRQVDDNRANATVAWDWADKAEWAAASWHKEVLRLQHELTQVPRPAVPRDDLLPPSSSSSSTPAPSQEPPPSEKTEAQRAKAKERKAPQKENKRQGALEREQERQVAQQQHEDGGWS